MAKNSREQARSRRARAEELRAAQRRQERRRSLLLLGIVTLVVVGLLALAVVPYVRHRQEQSRLAHMTLADFGVPRGQAACRPVQTRKAVGAGVHRAPGTPIRYPQAPPAFGPHWGNFLTGSEIKNFYTSAERPPVERLVHSLEHGYTLVWYDDTVRPGSASYRALQQMAGHMSTPAKFMAVPWHASDGGSFPGGAHIALTHWRGKPAEGMWQYCAKPSGAVVTSFVKANPPLNAPEPGAV